MGFNSAFKGLNASLNISKNKRESGALPPWNFKLDTRYRVQLSGLLHEPTAWLWERKQQTFHSLQTGLTPEPTRKLQKIKDCCSIQETKHRFFSFPALSPVTTPAELHRRISELWSMLHIHTCDFRVTMKYNLISGMAFDLDEWVPVTSTWRVLRLRMEERPPIWRIPVNILNKQSLKPTRGVHYLGGWAWC